MAADSPTWIVALTQAGSTSRSVPYEVPMSWPHFIIVLLVNAVLWTLIVVLMTPVILVATGLSWVIAKIRDYHSHHHQPLGGMRPAGH